MFSFDISFVDPTPLAGHPDGLYYLADRSNAALDVIDIATETLFGQIGGNGAGQANFTGDTGSTNTSGPDGVAAAFPCIFAGNGNSTLLSFNGNVDFTKVVTALNTGGQFRVDEMAIDPADGLVIAANNADDPPFSTIATYNKTTCALSNPIKTTFSALPGGHMNTNGIEQPVWDPATKRFYISLPEIDAVPPLAGGAGITGAVARVTTGGVIETIFPINYCQPAGLTLGPNGDLLVGCNSVFDNSGKKCTAVVPSPSPAGAPATCTGGTAYPQVAICNPGKGCTGSSLSSVFGAGGGDEVWFNSGDGNYYVTAGNNPIGPTFGVIDSTTKTLTQLVPTLPPIAASLAFTASLTQALEVPPTGSPATGSATVLVNQAASTLGVHVTFSGLTSGTIMAHIHCCLATPSQTGVNVGVATTVPAFPGFPLGVTSGTYDNVLDLTLASSYNPAFITAQGGTVAGAEAALIRGIENGETYLNIHTTNFPGGEIRNFLTPSPAAVVGAHSAGTAHSIAASAANNHVYVPLPANNNYTAPPVGTPACVQGCVAVFGMQ
jgi:hypothetical protein